MGRRKEEEGRKEGDVHHTTPTCPHPYHLILAFPTSSRVASTGDIPGINAFAYYAAKRRRRRLCCSATQHLPILLLPRRTARCVRACARRAAPVRAPAPPLTDACNRCACRWRRLQQPVLLPAAFSATAACPACPPGKPAFSAYALAQAL